MKIIKKEFLVSVKLPHDYGSMQISNGITVEVDDSIDDHASFMALKKQVEEDTIEEVKQLKNKVINTKDNKISLKL